jgi:hypothetical protein
LDGSAGAVSVPVGVRVLFPPPIFVTGSWVLVTEAVPLDEDVLPDAPDDADEVIVANVLPSKSEGTVGLGAASSPVRLRCDPDKVMTDGVTEAELLWAAVRPASHTTESIAPFMIATGVIVV